MVTREDSFDNWRAPGVLKGVELWAAGCFVIREIELIAAPRAEGEGPYIPGRVDALIVPASPSPDNPLARAGRRGWHLDQRRLYGVEVKVSRADFMRGFRSDQLSRYAAAVAGMYLACPPGVVRVGDLPDGVGLLVVESSRRPAVCVRRAKVSDVQPCPALFWKLFDALRERRRLEHAAERHAIEEALQAFGQAAGQAITAAVRAIPPPEDWA